MVPIENILNNLNYLKKGVDTFDFKL